MATLSKATAERVQDIGVGKVYEHVAGGYEFDILEMREDVDLAPLLRGLPDDRCTCPHWGYVVSGSVTFTFADHEESFEAGDGFHVGPGHSPRVTAGTEYLMISPLDEMTPVNEVIERNVAALLSG